MNNCGANLTFASVIFINTLGNALIFQLVPFLSPFQSTLLCGFVVVLSIISLTILFVLEMYVRRTNAKREQSLAHEDTTISSSGSTEFDESLEHVVDAPARRQSITKLSQTAPPSIQNRFYVLKAL